MIALLAAIALTVWLALRGGGDADPGTDPATSSAPTSQPTTAEPTTAQPTPTPTVEETTEPAEGETPPLPTACTPDQMSLSVVTPASARAGATVGASIEVATTTATPCLVNLGSGTTTVEVRSGEDLVWTSAQCPFDPSDRALLLGEGATDSQLVTWSGTRSADGCPAGQPTAEPGTYRAVVTTVLEGQTLTGESTFVLQ